MTHQTSVKLNAWDLAIIEESMRAYEFGGNDVSMKQYESLLARIEHAATGRLNFNYPVKVELLQLAYGRESKSAE